MKKKFAHCFRPEVIETDEPHHPGRAVAIAKGIIEGGKINGEVDFQEKASDLGESNGHIEKVEDHKRKRQANTTNEENKIVPTISSSSSTTSSSPSSCNVSSLSDQSSKDFKSLSMKRCLARTSSNTSFDKKKKAKITKTNDKTLDCSSLSPMQDKDFVFYWIVLALLAIILWGKTFAIVLASTWLYFIPRRSGHQHLRPENNSGKLPEVETCTDDHCSWEYKKKVIMEGLLERKSTAPTESIKSPFG